LLPNQQLSVTSHWVSDVAILLAKRVIDAELQTAEECVGEMLGCSRSCRRPLRLKVDTRQSL